MRNFKYILSFVFSLLFFFTTLQAQQNVFKNTINRQNLRFADPFL